MSRVIKFRRRRKQREDRMSVVIMFSNGDVFTVEGERMAALRGAQTIFKNLLEKEK